MSETILEEAAPATAAGGDEAAKSTHRVEVVPVVLEPHPNADRLSVVKVWGYTCVVATDDWKGVDRAAYLPPDSVADCTRPEFAFLRQKPVFSADGQLVGRVDDESITSARVRAKKLRGVLSFGLLVPAPAGAAVGDDVAARLGVTHYDPDVKRAQGKSGLKFGGEVEKAPDVYHVKYDLEAGRRYAQLLFAPGEPVLVTEKIHGANARYVFHAGRMYCGSRTEWKKEFPSYDHLTVEGIAAQIRKKGEVSEQAALAQAGEAIEKLRSQTKRRNLWWQALEATPALRAFCEANPDTVVYGEVYGQVQDLKYGTKPGEVRFAAFDLLRAGRWVDAPEAHRLLREVGVPTVPVLNPDAATPLPFDFDRVCALAEGKSLVPGAGHVREGVVVAPWAERYDPRHGRVKLKWVAAGYLERSKDPDPQPDGDDE